ncbi:hypothetical protein HAX54_026815 [Datura stramonium]|uniref:Uncharacterized protein n=1 Tax=Datura stramonium TaxID=4076 RepID=A0ABS8S868_DATST|nr:hypothetical protein [Datura stramonium]
MLLQRRTKELQLQKEKSLVGCSVERMKSLCHPTSSKQIVVTIREPSATNIKESGCYEVNTLLGPSDKGKKALHPAHLQQNITHEVVTNTDHLLQHGIRATDRWLII